MVVAYLIKCEGMPLQDALQLVKEKRAVVNPNPVSWHNLRPSTVTMADCGWLRVSWSSWRGGKGWEAPCMAERPLMQSTGSGNGVWVTVL